MNGRGATQRGDKVLAKQWNDQAVAVLAPVADAARTDPLLANLLGTAYLGASDNIPSAEQWFRTASTIDPSNVDARANLASTLADQNKLPDAIVVYEQAHKLDPRTRTSRSAWPPRTRR